jgi:hypothetical protein
MPDSKEQKLIDKILKNVSKKYEQAMIDEVIYGCSIWQIVLTSDSIDIKNVTTDVLRKEGLLSD